MEGDNIFRILFKIRHRVRLTWLVREKERTMQGGFFLSFLFGYRKTIGERHRKVK